MVVDENKKLIGTLTDGDIRRYILKTGSLEGNIDSIFNKKCKYIYINEIDKAREIIFKYKIELLPVVNENKEVINYYKWTDFYEVLEYDIKLDVPVVIMAGGKGLRMSPFTKVLPKPLLPLKGKTLIENVIDSFKKFGIRKFYITLNYKGKIIETYFNSMEKDYEVDFIWEDNFLGTAGSLYYLKQKINTDFFVSNCDILLKVNYFEIFNYHKSNDAILTSITSVNYYRIPYGVVSIKENGVIEKIIEKPEYTFIVNTGVYILKDKVFEYINEKIKLDMPNLMHILIENKEKVISYPVMASDYIDFGELETYQREVDYV